eukprot:TRINITY_DN777957_c0_g1_i1.p1 TRINITY_DN777957_c0_g1~~TRINITY_DN777957_c0_g1_i1.p1  ORF type:complete len:288 (-),score=70.08 TRINITY_DN777957_c0_g1_i1:124-987(-)
MYVSLSERKFISEGVIAGIRGDGRNSTDFRPIIIETNILPNANGSTRILGRGLDILVAVSAEIGETDQNKGSVVVDVKAANETEETNVKDTLESMLLSKGAFPMEKLVVIPGKYAWTVFIDVQIKQSNGNTIDLTAFGAYCAINCCRVAALKYIKDGTGELIDFEVNPNPYDAVPLECNLTINLTLRKIAGTFIVDPTAAEEACSEGGVGVSINSSGKVCAVRKQGAGEMDPKEIFAAMKVGQNVADEIFAKLKAALEEEKRVFDEKVKAFKIALQVEAEAKHGFMI